MTARLAETPTVDDLAAAVDRPAHGTDRMVVGRPGSPAVIAFPAGAGTALVTGGGPPVDGGLGASNGQPRMSR